MPSPQAKLDLDTWAKFKPKERANDFEYNLLVYKFKTFLEEVKEFQSLHNNCSVTKSLLSINNNNFKSPTISRFNQNSFNEESTSQLPTTATQTNANTSNRFTGNSLNDQHQQSPQSISSINSRKTFFQHQNSVPVVSSTNQNDGGDTNYRPNHMHFNSTYNLNINQDLSSPRSNCNNSTNNNNNVTKPEIKQRGLVSGSKFLLSKSSERLDSINNNAKNSVANPKVMQNSDKILQSNSLKNNDLSKNKNTYNNGNLPVVRDSRYLEDDGNIYDAVSPDDNLNISSENDDPNLAGSSAINNVNRFSMSQKSKLESSKSSLVLGSISGADVNQNVLSASYNSKGGMIMSKSTPYRNSNNETVEHSSNSFGSSIIFDATNSSSSLSILPGHNNSNGTNNSNIKNSSKNSNSKFCNNTSEEYADYVNIDFFLKRSHSPSFDGLDEDVTNEDSSEEVESDNEDETQLSHSLSSDQIGDEVLRSMSPQRNPTANPAPSTKSHGDNKFGATKGACNNQSASLTPASSGDLLDEPPSCTSFNSMSYDNNNKLNKQPVIASSNNRLGSFFHSSISTKERETPILTKVPIINSTKDTDDKGLATTAAHHTLNTIKENQQHDIPRHNSISDEPNSISRNDNSALTEAQNNMRTFLSELNLSSNDDVFEDKAQRRIVKESFAVEFCGRRKLRHLFLFNDVIVCAKYQASSKQKFTFDVKWYLNLSGVSVSDSNDASSQVKFDKEAVENQILSIRTNLALLRGQIQQIKRSKQKQNSKITKKLKKKRTELEAELVLLLPHLPLIIKHVNGKKYTFFLSSSFDRNQWIESIKFLQSQLPTSKGTQSTSPSSNELQAWIQTCRKNLNPSLGTFLLRSNCDDDLLYGDLYLNLNCVKGITKEGQYYFCFEVDSYGHFSQKASSPVLHVVDQEHNLNEEYVFPLDGAHTLRILLYEEQGRNLKPSVIGKAHIELSRACFLDKSVEKVVVFNSNCSLVTKLSYSSSELLSMRVPHAKLCPTFGMDITQVCKKEKTNVPLIIQMCVNEVERRGMKEVGIYRMSGTSTDIQKLKKAFETNPYVAELLLRDIDINSVTGFLKTYLREMPEGLFSDKLYPKFVAAFNTPQSESFERTKKMLDLFHKIPITNQHTIIYLVKHLVKIYKYESYNKMSLTNLATVLGPNILRPPTDSSGTNSADPFTEVVIGSMSQAGILYFFLNRKYSNLPLTELDSSEMKKFPSSPEANDSSK